MNPRDLIPTAEQIKAVQGLEAELLQRRLKGKMGFLVGIGGALLQVVLAVGAKENLITNVGNFFGGLRRLHWSQLAAPQAIGFYAIVLGFGTYFIYRRTSLLAKESREPFQYTFWIDAFKEVAGTPDVKFSLARKDRLSLFDHDLMERLSLGIRRLSLLNAEVDVPKEARANLTSHIHVHGHFALREQALGNWVLQIMPVIRIGPLGRPEIMATSIKVDLKPDADNRYSLSVDRYEQLVEHVYSIVASEIYRQIRTDLKAKSDLFPTRYLRAVALHYEAVDFERSNTIDAYDYAIDLYREAKYYFDNRWLRWLPHILVELPIVWPLAKRSLLAEATARVGLARSLIYRRVVSALSGRNQNVLFEVPTELEIAINDLTTLQNRMISRRQLRARIGKIPRASTTSGIGSKGEPAPGALASQPAESKLESVETYGDALAVADVENYRSLLGFLTFPFSLSRRWRNYEAHSEVLSNAYSVKALAYQYLGARIEASEHLTRAKAINPASSQRNPIWWLAKAESEPDLNMKLLLLKQATELAPDFEIARYRFAYAAEIKLRMRGEIKKERVEGVIKQYDEVLAINPSNIGALLAQGYLRWLLEDLNAAEQKFQEGSATKAIVRQTFNGEALYGLARIAVEKGNINQAYDLYTDAIFADPEVAAYRPIGSNQLIRSSYDFITSDMMDRYERFLRNTENILRDAHPSNGPDSSSSGESVSDRTLRAVHSFVLNDYGNACLNYFLRFGELAILRKAIEAYESAIEHNKENFVACYNLNTANNWNDNTAPRDDLLEHAQQLAPAWPAVLIESMRSRIQQTRRDIEAKTRDLTNAYESLEKAEVGAGLDQVQTRSAASPQGGQIQAEASMQIEQTQSVVVPPTDQAKIDSLKAELEGLKLRLSKEIFPKIREIMERTKWPAAAKVWSLDYNGKGVDQLLRARLERDRLDETDLHALAVWADILSTNDKSYEALLATENLCTFIEQYYPENPITALSLYSAYMSIPATEENGNDSKDAKGSRSKRKTKRDRELAELLKKHKETQGPECAARVARVIESWLSTDKLNFASLKWATEFTTVISEERQQQLLEAAIKALEDADNERGVDRSHIHDATKRGGHGNKTTGAYHYLLGNLCYRTNKLKEAVEYYEEACSRSPEEPSYFNSLGDAYYQKEDYAKAKSAYEQAIRLDGETAIYHSNLAGALRELKQWERAILEANEARNREPKTETKEPKPSSNTKILVSIHNAQAHDHFDKGEFAQAKACYEQAIFIDKNTAINYSFLSRALRGLKEFGRAKEAANKAIKMEPDAPYHRRQMSLILNAEGVEFDNKSELLKAIEKYEEAIASCEGEDLLYLNLSSAWARLNGPDTAAENLKKAIAALQKAIDLKPDNGDYGKRMDELQVELQALKMPVPKR